MWGGTVLALLSLFRLGVADKSNENFDYKVKNISLWNGEENTLGKPMAYTEVFEIIENSTTTIQIVDISDKVGFIVAQVHGHLRNVTISYDEQILRKNSKRSVEGTNVGLYYPINGEKVVKLYLNNVFNVTVLLAVVTYSLQAPIPGGCNMEYNIETSPFQVVRLKEITVSAEAQPASKPRIYGEDSCQTGTHVEHNMYMTYLTAGDYSPESYFAVIKKLLTPDDVVENAAEMPLSTFGSAMRRVYSAYHGTGSAYAVVAVYGNHSAAYVPGFTYACDPLNVTDTCNVLYSTSLKIVCVLFLFFGVFITFLELMKTKVFAVTILAGIMIGCILCSNIGIWKQQMSIAAIMIGVGFACFWWILWLILGMPGMLTFICNLSFGFVCSSLMYYYMPDDTYFRESNFYFWTMFLLLMMIITTICAIVPHFGVRFSCAALCSMLIVVTLDFMFGSNLKYVFINVVRRINNPDFCTAIVHAPHQTKDIILLNIWPILLVISLVRSE